MLELRTGGLHEGNTSPGPCVRLAEVHSLYAGTEPSQAERRGVRREVDEIAHVTRHLLDELVQHRAAEGPRGRGGKAARTGCRALRGLTAR